jgi:hypothetical protein
MRQEFATLELMRLLIRRRQKPVVSFSDMQKPVGLGESWPNEYSKMMRRLLSSSATAVLISACLFYCMVDLLYQIT